MARLVADLPKLKAAVETGDPPTVEPLAQDYQAQARRMLMRSRPHRARAGAAGGRRPSGPRGHGQPGGRRGPGRARGDDLPLRRRRGVLEVVTVPIVIGAAPPEILGTLSVGFALDDGLAARVQARSPRARSPSRSAARVRRLHPAPRSTTGRSSGAPRRPAPWSLTLDGERVRRARAARSPRAGAGASGGRRVSSCARAPSGCSFLRTFRAGLFAAALVAVALAVLLSYAVARTVTRPLRRHHRGHARDGGDRRPRAGRSRSPGRWEDEDARAAGRGLQRADRGHRPLPARGGAARAPLRPGPPLHRHRPRDAQPAHDHQGLAAHAAPGRASPRGERREAAARHRRARSPASTASWTTCSTSRGRSSSSCAPTWTSTRCAGTRGRARHGRRRRAGLERLVAGPRPGPARHRRRAAARRRSSTS